MDEGDAIDPVAILYWPGGLLIISFFADQYHDFSV